ncbi:MFS transporter [Francisellaceae bacterium CB300]
MSFSIRIQTLLIALLFTVISSFLQVSPSVNADYLIHSLAVDEDLLLKLTTLYFLSYAILQVPNGYILDTKGIEKVFPISIFIVFIGSVLYWLSSNSLLIGFSRLIIGAGCSTAYIISLFIATKYFNKAIIPLLISFAEIAGGLGDYLAGNSYLYILNNFGWDIANFIIIFVLFVLLIYSLIVLKVANLERSKQDSVKVKSFAEMMLSMRNIFKSSTNIAVFAYSFFTWGIIMAFAGYWAKNYYITMHNYSKEFALSLPEIYWLSFLISALVIGSLVKSITQTKKYIISLSILGVIAYLTMITPMLFSYSLLVFITILSGISASGVILAFFIIQHLVSDEEKGLAISINNLFIVLGGMLGQLSFSKAISFNFNNLFMLNDSVNSFFYSGIVMLTIWAVLALTAILFVIKKI